MAAIDPDRASKLLDAVETIREWLPEAEALSSLIPMYGEKIVEGEKFLGKLFELVVALKSHETVADASATLRAQTEAEWQAALRRE